MRWSRRPPLRFNEVALPAAVAVSQAGFARGGGWARLSLAVSRAEFPIKAAPLDLAQNQRQIIAAWRLG